MNAQTKKDILFGDTDLFFRATDKEIKWQKEEVHDTNSAKAIRKMEQLQNLLLTVKSETVFKVEGCREDEKRGFSLPNAGSLAECIIKYHLLDEPDEIEKEWDDEKPDVVYDGIGYEIKAALVANSKATKKKNNFPTIFYNPTGVYIISAEEYAEKIGENGKLKSTMVFKNRITWLEEILLEG